MKNTTYTWQSFDNGELFAQSWIPETEPKAVINFVHGIGEHSSRYHDWMPFFCDAGYAVFAIEYRGHGRSFGKRGYIKSYEHILKDIDVLFEQSKKAYPELSQFLYGHSLGGNIVTNYALRRKPNIIGLIATSPWFSLTNEPPAWQISAIRLLHKIMPGFIIKSNLKTKDISQSADLVKKYEKDELVHNKISLELLLSAFDNGKWALDNAEHMPIPTFLTHGAEDKITSPKASETFYNTNPEKITFKLWNGMLHELHNEPIREELAKMLIDWLDKTLEADKH
jgi:alpha-beta hydrolase superfamily lysophospholipase